MTIQEIKREKIDHRFIASIWKSRFVEWRMLPLVGRAGGILVMLESKTINISDSSFGEYFISVKNMKDAESCCWFSSVYGPNNARNRSDFGTNWRG